MHEFHVHFKIEWVLHSNVCLTLTEDHPWGQGHDTHTHGHTWEWAGRDGHDAYLEADVFKLLAEGCDRPGRACPQLHWGIPWGFLVPPVPHSLWFGLLWSCVA
jgi:hypothetical protein